MSYLNDYVKKDGAFSRRMEQDPDMWKKVEGELLRGTKRREIGSSNLRTRSSKRGAKRSQKPLRAHLRHGSYNVVQTEEGCHVVPQS
jgi:hypothetical protein